MLDVKIKDYNITIIIKRGTQPKFKVGVVAIHKREVPFVTYCVEEESLDYGEVIKDLVSPGVSLSWGVAWSEALYVVKNIFFSKRYRQNIKIHDALKVFQNI